MAQYTIRNVPQALDRQLRELAERKGKSLNDAVIEAMARGLGLADTEIIYDDLDDLIGTWKRDEEFDRAIAEQDKVDTEAFPKISPVGGSV